MRIAPRFRLKLPSLVVLAVALTSSACGVTEPESPPASVQGVWQSTIPSVAETTLELAADGSATLLSADLVSLTCQASTGRWSRTEDELVIDIDAIAGAPASAQERFSITSGTLTRSSNGASESFRRLAQMITCVDYGWGEWVGTFSASIDGVSRSFAPLDVELDITAGTLRITALWKACDTCAFDTPELVVEIDAGSGGLTTGSYTVQNVPGAVRTLYGFFHPDPGNATFLGFSTERLSPTGEFRLEGLAADRLIGTFDFRANPLADGQVAPDGSTTTLITDGAVNLDYR